MAVSKIWNGSVWVTGVLKSWNGSAWIAKPNFHNGTAWTSLYSTGAGTVLTLNPLASNRTVFGIQTVIAGVGTVASGEVQEIAFNGFWTAQNPGTEWINDGGATASQYEVQLVGTGATVSGPALNSFHSCDVTRRWTVSRSSQGTSSFLGQMTIREIANTANSVSAGATMSATVDAL